VASPALPRSLVFITILHTGNQRERSPSALIIPAGAVQAFLIPCTSGMNPGIKRFPHRDQCGPELPKAAQPSRPVDNLLYFMLELQSMQAKSKVNHETGSKTSLQECQAKRIISNSRGTSIAIHEPGPR
jgi:hypothetical protein